ncbi:MAG: CBS domain-containing protein [Rhodospirillaceae bacterium]|jgi:CBS domain-containing protein|nr:CBS domain-containing protein [Rhodospirillaceae bacterium]
MMRKIVPDVISLQTLIIVSQRDTARDIAKLMHEKRVAAVMVTEGDCLVGIITERDMTTRVVAAGNDPNTSTAKDIMTANPDTLHPNDTPAQAIKMMIERNYRHLPVTDGETLVGMVSVRDLYAIYNLELEEDLKDRNAFIYGENYGTG